jgi:hypothetical protein
MTACLMRLAWLLLFLLRSHSYPVVRSWLREQAEERRGAIIAIQTVNE